ncbi:hypothetical protein AC480_02220 [miscellaneous Crenarchaeota group archaeon SMTZ1-55]|nr:MAG: hypothetical protein AC480_02220 [miscellaneous Crenarchaeota group archaeon SMTZ1-55]
MQAPPERLGSFFLGAEYDVSTGNVSNTVVNYDARDLTTHALCVGMTGSGKTGLCIGLLEEAALDKVPAILIDPKGDITNLMLQFPQLNPEDFRPWVNPDDARRKGKTVEEYARYVADLWRKGLADWGIGPDRIRLLRESAGFSIYTPGSDAGLPVSILSSFAAPDVNFEENAEAVREQITGTVAALLELVGVDADPVRSREAILLSTVFEHYWRKNEDLDLPKLITSIQKPPVRQLGVFDVDTFYPAKHRFELAMAFNTLVASPSFQSWLNGAPLDIDRLLYSEDGTPRHSIFYIAHLSDRERMFFVTLLLENLLTWTRRQTGTTSLRALLYFDEVFGFFPPVAEPPSKRPLLTLLKQARAFGLGLLLVTQNPVDLDYKGLTNMGTWFIGKLQAERDKDRVLQGLKGAILEAGGGGEKVDYSALINKLSSRIFLMHNVHAKQPVVFHTRWVMSYLRGPLTRPQVSQLMSVHKHRGPDIKQVLPEPARRPTRAPTPSIGPSTLDASTPRPPADFSVTLPALDPSITQVFLPIETGEQETIRQFTRTVGATVRVESATLVYKPSVLGVATLRFVDRKHNIDEQREQILLAGPPEAVGGVNWGAAESLPLRLNDLSRNPEPVSSGQEPFFAPIPEYTNSARDLKQISKDLVDWLYYNSRLRLRAHPDLGVIQRPDEGEREFIIRVQQVSRERRDVEVDKLETKYAKRLDRLESKMRRLQRELADDEAEHEARKREEVVGIGESVLSFFMGRRRTSSITTATRRRRYTSKAKMDIAQTRDEIAELKADMHDLEDEIGQETKAITDKWEKAQADLITQEIKPRRTDVDLQLTAFAWRPLWLIAYSDHGIPRETYVPAYHQTDDT